MHRIRSTWRLLLLLLLPSSLLAQTRTISGTIRDENGRPMTGASVTVKRTGAGTSTDSTGKFSVQAATGSIIILSAVNYEDVSIVVGQASHYNIAFKQKASQLNDVVVVGYGTQKKADLTGAIETIDKKLIENRPVTNSVAALQGTAPGLVITRFSGQPGKEEYAANIRGFSSINGTNTALVLIDGVEGDLTLLNPNDIESISVLKDAAAVSIYGAKAAGGRCLGWGHGS